MTKIAVTGYYGTGSSAVLDLLREFDGVKAAIGTRYEHNLFVCHDGLLDLEQRLFGENSDQMIRDVAINEFQKEMDKQYRYDFGWYGSYKRVLGPAFQSAVQEFVDAISVVGGQDLFSHTTKTRFSPAKAVLQIGAAVLTGYKIKKLGRKYVHDRSRTRYLTTDRDGFTAAAKKFTSRYFELCAPQGAGVAVFDHVLMPEQRAAAGRLFDDLKLIVVDRDPRDVYQSAYHVWNRKKFGSQVAPFPLGVEAFCANWKRIHRGADVAYGNVETVRFEDLIYDYDATVDRLCAFCGLDRSAHRAKGTIFRPEESVKNTQVFRKDPAFSSDNAAIERALSEYLYDFPYETVHGVDDAFDR